MASLLWTSSWRAEFNKGRGCVKRYRMAAAIEGHVTQSPCAQNVWKGTLWLNVLFSKNSFISGKSRLYIVPEYYVFLCHELTFIQFTLFFDWFQVSNCLTSAWQHYVTVRISKNSCPRGTTRNVARQPVCWDFKTENISSRALLADWNITKPISVPSGKTDGRQFSCDKGMKLPIGSVRAVTEQHQWQWRNCTSLFWVDRQNICPITLYFISPFGLFSPIWT